MSRRGRAIFALIAAVLVAALVATAIVAERLEQSQQISAKAEAITGGNPEAGRGKISFYGCGGCHQIPGVERANGKVGPPLNGIAGRLYIAGELENTPENMMQWIQDPHSIDADTAMPTLGVKPKDARDIAAYLYTLE